ncbi:MAG: putative cupin superfamily sugar epimerase [Planctomycetota bacterium]|jgi:predicted cupin superfamily sugar epimerase
MNKLSAEEIIKHLGLQPLPIEGGYFAVSYTSDEQIQANALPDRYANARNIGGAIYFMETSEQFSAMHQLPTDELYYYHYGDPMEMLFLYPDGKGETRLLGADLAAGQRPQILAPRHSYHGSRPLTGGEFGFSLGSTSMAPGYDQSDSVFPPREELVRAYPEFASLITALTRLIPHNI